MAIHASIYIFHAPSTFNINPAFNAGPRYQGFHRLNVRYMGTLSDEINGCRFLDLRQISEPRDNALRVLIEEARGSGTFENIFAGVPVSGTQPIASDASCSAFDLVWDTYIAYSIRNESFVSSNDYERFEGRLFCVYSVSLYLDYIRRDTIAAPDYPGPLQHYGINCLNHIIDVVSFHAPQITKVR